MGDHGANKKAKIMWALSESKGQGLKFYNLGSVQQIEAKIPSAAGTVGSALQKSEACVSGSTEAHGRKGGTSSVVRGERSVGLQR